MNEMIKKLLYLKFLFIVFLLGCGDLTYYEYSPKKAGAEVVEEIEVDKPFDQIIIDNNILWLLDCKYHLSYGNNICDDLKVQERDLSGFDIVQDYDIKPLFDQFYMPTGFTKANENFYYQSDNKIFLLDSAFSNIVNSFTLDHSEDFIFSYNDICYNINSDYFIVRLNTNHINYSNRLHLKKIEFDTNTAVITDIYNGVENRYNTDIKGEINSIAYGYNFNELWILSTIYLNADQEENHIHCINLQTNEVTNKIILNYLGDCAYARYIYYYEGFIWVISRTKLYKLKIL